eukprot:scaffold8770_cov107-Isochrysis_galbana.AAC.5
MPSSSSRWDGSSPKAPDSSPWSSSWRARAASSPTFSARASDAICTSSTWSKAEMGQPAATAAAMSADSPCASLHTLMSRTRSPTTACATPAGVGNSPSSMCESYMNLSSTPTRPGPGPRAATRPS